MPSFVKRPFDYLPPHTPLDIVYEDEHYLILNKPAGLLSVAGKAENHQDCLESRAKAHNKHARIIHRLDMSTSGIMVLALTAESHRHIGLQFEKRYITKSYAACVWGQIKGESGHINLPLICDWPNRPLQMVDFTTGKSAQTDWEVTKRKHNSTYLKLHPITGRSHQLRVHLLSLGHPIMGDRLYAHEDAFTASQRLMLHAQSLTFRHPDGGEHVHYEVNTPF